MHFHFLGYQIASLHVGNKIPIRRNKILRLGKKIQALELCNVLELVDNFGFLISFFFDKFIC